MKMPILIRASTNEERHAATTKLRDALSAAGAAITDVRFFSNAALVIQMEIDSGALGALADALTAVLAVADDSLSALRAAGTEREGPVSASLHVTFVHHEPDMEREVPKVPG